MAKKDVSKVMEELDRRSGLKKPIPPEKIPEPPGENEDSLLLPSEKSITDLYDQKRDLLKVELYTILGRLGTDVARIFQIIHLFVPNRNKDFDGGSTGSSVDSMDSIPEVAANELRSQFVSLVKPLLIKPLTDVEPPKEITNG